jgi:hypothetical protein
MNERARRILEEARANAERLRDFKVEQRDIGEPDVMQEWDSLKPQPEPVRRERGLDTKPPDLVYKIHEGDQPDSDSGPGPELDGLTFEVISEVIARERRATVELSDQVHELRIELARLTSVVAQLGEDRALDRSAVVDMPNPVQGRRIN